MTFDSHSISFDQQNACQNCVGVTDPYRGEKIVFDVTSAAVPEPVTWAMMISGLRVGRRCGA